MSGELVAVLFAVGQVLVVVGACVVAYRIGKRDAIVELFANSEETSDPPGTT